MADIANKPNIADELRMGTSLAGFAASCLG
jgi:hypothetical protein